MPFEVGEQRGEGEGRLKCDSIEIVNENTLCVATIKGSTYNGKF